MDQPESAPPKVAHTPHRLVLAKHLGGGGATSEAAEKDLSPQPIDITAAMDAYFGVVEIGRELSTQGLMYDGLTRPEAEKELARRELDRFRRREAPPFSARFPRARIWG